MYLEEESQIQMQDCKSEMCKPTLLSQEKEATSYELVASCESCNCDFADVGEGGLPSKTLPLHVDSNRIYLAQSLANPR